MSNVSLPNLARSSTQSGGTGSLVLSSDAVESYQLIQSAVQVGRQFDYSLTDGSGQREVGRGTMQAGSVMTRDSIFYSTNGNNKVDLAEGGTIVTLTIAGQTLSQTICDGEVIGTQLVLTRTDGSTVRIDLPTSGGGGGAGAQGAQGVRYFNIWRVQGIGDADPARPVGGQATADRVTLAPAGWNVFVPSIDEDTQSIWQSTTTYDPATGQLGQWETAWRISGIRGPAGGGGGGTGATTFRDLTDTPSFYGVSGQVPVVNPQGNGLEWGDRQAGGGATTFTGLTDTPNSLAGQGGRYLAVNPQGTAVDVVDAPSGGGGVTTFTGLTDTAPTLGAPGQFVAVNQLGSGLIFVNAPTGSGAGQGDTIVLNNAFGQSTATLTQEQISGGGILEIGVLSWYQTGSRSNDLSFKHISLTRLGQGNIDDIVIQDTSRYDASPLEVHRNSMTLIDWNRGTRTFTSQVYSERNGVPGATSTEPAIVWVAVLRSGAGGGTGGGGATSFTQLSDTPGVLGAAGQVAAVNPQGTALEWVNQTGTGGGATTFTELTDTPSAFGSAGQIPTINSAGTALEWTNAPTIPPPGVSQSDFDALEVRVGQTFNAANFAGGVLSLTRDDGDIVSVVIPTGSGTTTGLTQTQVDARVRAHTGQNTTTGDFAATRLPPATTSVAGAVRLGSVTAGSTATVPTGASVYQAIQNASTGGADTFTELTDTPASLGTSGQIPAVNADRSALEWIDAPTGGGGGGVTRFTALTDTPDLLGETGQVAAVNTDGTALEWVTPQIGLMQSEVDARIRAYTGQSSQSGTIPYSRLAHFNIGAEGVTIGEDATTTGLNSNAIGDRASAQEGGTAVGESASAGINAVGVGNDPTASGMQSVAIGDGTVASGAQGIAVGREAVVHGVGGIAFGNYTDTQTNDYDVAAGWFSGSTLAAGGNRQMRGYYCSATAIDSVERGSTGRFAPSKVADGFVLVDPSHIWQKRNGQWVDIGSEGVQTWARTADTSRIPLDKLQVYRLDAAPTGDNWDNMPNGAIVMWDSDGTRETSDMVVVKISDAGLDTSVNPPVFRDPDRFNWIELSNIDVVETDTQARLSTNADRWNNLYSDNQLIWLTDTQQLIIRVGNTFTEGTGYQVINGGNVDEAAVDARIQAYTGQDSESDTIAANKLPIGGGSGLGIGRPATQSDIDAGTNTQRWVTPALHVSSLRQAIANLPDDPDLSLAAQRMHAHLSIAPDGYAYHLGFDRIITIDDGAVLDGSDLNGATTTTAGINFGIPGTVLIGYGTDFPQFDVLFFELGANAVPTNTVIAVLHDGNAGYHAFISTNARGEYVINYPGGGSGALVGTGNTLTSMSYDRLAIELAKQVYGDNGETPDGVEAVPVLQRREADGTLDGAAHQLNDVGSDVGRVATAAHFNGGIVFNSTYVTRWGVGHHNNYGSHYVLAQGVARNWPVGTHVLNLKEASAETTLTLNSDFRVEGRFTATEANITKIAGVAEARISQARYINPSSPDDDSTDIVQDYTTAAALRAFVPSGLGTAGQILATTGTGTEWIAAPTAGTPDGLNQAQVDARVQAYTGQTSTTGDFAASRLPAATTSAAGAVRLGTVTAGSTATVPTGANVYETINTRIEAYTGQSSTGSRIAADKLPGATESLFGIVRLGAVAQGNNHVVPTGDSVYQAIQNADTGATTFIDLTDTPAAYTDGDSGRVPAINADRTGLEWIHTGIIYTGTGNPSSTNPIQNPNRGDIFNSNNGTYIYTGVSSHAGFSGWQLIGQARAFTDLSDTPITLGSAGQFPVVNQQGTGLEWSDPVRAAESAVIYSNSAGVNTYTLEQSHVDNFAAIELGISNIGSSQTDRAKDFYFTISTQRLKQGDISEWPLVGDLDSHASQNDTAQLKWIRDTRVLTVSRQDGLGLDRNRIRWVAGVGAAANTGETNNSGLTQAEVDARVQAYTGQTSATGTIADDRLPSATVSQRGIVIYGSVADSDTGVVSGGAVFDAIEAIDTGATTFTELTDTPSTLGSREQVPVMNSTATALEWQGAHTLLANAIDNGDITIWSFNETPGGAAANNVGQILHVVDTGAGNLPRYTLAFTDAPSGGSTTLTGLTDTPDSFGTAGQVLKVNADRTAVVWASETAGIENFTQLNDAPSNYGNSGQIIESTGTGLRWADAPSAGDNVAKTYSGSSFPSDTNPVSNPNLGDIYVQSSGIVRFTYIYTNRTVAIGNITTAGWERFDRVESVGELDDVPNTLGNPGQVLAVNTNGDSLEYIDPPSGGTGGGLTQAQVDARIQAYTGQTSSTANIPFTKLPIANESQLGVAERATQAEVDAGTDTSRFVTSATLQTKLNALPSGVSQSQVDDRIENATGLQINTAGTVSGTINTERLPTATDGSAGIVELATTAETQAGSANNRAVTPVALSNRTATTTRTGLVELATQAEETAGTADNVLPTVAGVKRMIDEHAPSGGGGDTTFLQHTDTPSAYTGNAGHTLRVNDTGTGITFDLVGSSVLLTRDFNIDTIEEARANSPGGNTGVWIVASNQSTSNGIPTAIEIDGVVYGRDIRNLPSGITAPSATVGFKAGTVLRIFGISGTTYRFVYIGTIPIDNNPFAA